MRRLLLTLALLGLPALADTLTEAEARFGALQSYRVTLRADDTAGRRQVIRYFFRKPGWVRMEFVEPHRGAVLIYAPDTGRVRLWPFGLDRWPVLTLAPDHPWLRDPQGHRVDRSDVGVLLARLQALRAHGSALPLGETELAGRSATGLDIAGPADGPAATAQRYRVWLARETLFPLRVDRLAADGAPIETVDMSDAEVDVRFPERFFTP